MRSYAAPRMATASTASAWGMSTEGMPCRLATPGRILAQVPTSSNAAKSTGRRRRTAESSAPTASEMRGSSRRVTAAMWSASARSNPWRSTARTRRPRDARRASHPASGASEAACRSRSSRIAARIAGRLPASRSVAARPVSTATTDGPPRAARSDAIRSTTSRCTVSRTRIAIRGRGGSVRRRGTSEPPAAATVRATAPPTAGTRPKRPPPRPSSRSAKKSCCSSAASSATPETVRRSGSAERRCATAPWARSRACMGSIRGIVGAGTIGSGEPAADPPYNRAPMSLNPRAAAGAGAIVP